jgi:hypothetical protein
MGHELVEKGRGLPPDPPLPTPVSVAVGSQRAWRQPTKGQPLHILDALLKGLAVRV